MVRWLAVFLAGLLAACSGDEARPPAGGDGRTLADASAHNGVDDGDGGDQMGRAQDASARVLEGSRGTRIFEVRQPLAGEGAPVASNNYFCSLCIMDDSARASYESATYPEGFSVSPRRTVEAARARLFPPENSRGAPETLDLLPTIEGEEFRLGAQPLFGEIVDGMAVLVTMESSRRLAWDAGDTVHELDDGADVYVLFAQVREPDVAPPNDMALPTGFSYATRELDAPFVLEPLPRVVVFLHLTDQHLWQRIRPPD